jgi:hypothetical protein
MLIAGWGIGAAIGGALGAGIVLWALAHTIVRVLEGRDQSLSRQAGETEPCGV